MTMLLRIAERVLNRPLLVHPDKLPILMAVLQGRIPLGELPDLKEVEARLAAMAPEVRTAITGPAPDASRFAGVAEEIDPATGRSRGLPYRRTPEGVALIPVIGSLVNRGVWLESYSGKTSYEGIKFQVDQAAADPRTKAILLDIHSPGGEATGAFETADAVRAAAKLKPVTAVVNGMAASAAYAIAAGASRIITTPTGVSGSIGVVMLHADFSAALEQQGVKPTLIFAGAHKVDGNPFEPLSPGVRDDLQAEVEQFYALFVKSVAAGRKGMSASDIRATEARTFIGKSAVDAGLADAVGTFESALADISRGSGRAMSIPAKGSKMDKTEGAPAAEAGIAKADHDAAVAKAKAEGIAEGSKAAQTRIKTILGSEQAKGREPLAQHLAFETDTPAEAAVAILDKSPKGSAVTPPIAERMEVHGDALNGGRPAARRTEQKPPNSASIYERRRQASAPKH